MGAINANIKGEALWVAARHGYTETVRALITNPGLMAAITIEDKAIALHFAVQNNHLATRDAFFAHMNAVEQGAVLVWLAEHGHTETIRAFLTNAAVMTELSSTDKTIALIQAIHHHHTAISQMLAPQVSFFEKLWEQIPLMYWHGQERALLYAITGAIALGLYLLFNTATLFLPLIAAQAIFMAWGEYPPSDTDTVALVSAAQTSLDNDHVEIAERRRTVQFRPNEESAGTRIANNDLTHPATHTVKYSA